MNMSDDLEQRYAGLLDDLKHYGRVAVAFSGGVDSTFLAKAAFVALGDNAVALTVDSQAYPPESIEESRALAKEIGIRLIELPTDVCAIPHFCDNPPDRCYHCKKALFTMMRQRAASLGADVVLDGSNVDDDADFRPGHRALVELGIVSPLKERGFTKDMIRAMSRKLGLPTWDRQSFACLASRFPYGDRIDPEALQRTASAEKALRDIGIKRYRVRNHGDVARIEVDEDSFRLLTGMETRRDIVSCLKELGYAYVALDLEGYRTGSMNETLTVSEREDKQSS